MNKLSKSESHDPNYLAVVTTIPEIKEHPNANKLSLVEIFGNTIVIGKDSYKAGAKVIYFPVECCIDAEFLSWANLFDRPELNQDGKTKGFFSPKGCRVKAVRLREVASQGFLLPAFEAAKYFKIKEEDFVADESFDMANGKVFVKKYQRPLSPAQAPPKFKKSRLPVWLDKTLGVLPKPVRRLVAPAIHSYYEPKSESFKTLIVENQFSFHYKTEHLGRNIFLVDPEDVVTIGVKAHGTSSIFSNILCYDKQNWISKLLKIPRKSSYKFIYSSRSIIKNRHDGKFSDDVWGSEAAKLQGRIPPGYTVYGEIVGHTPSGKAVQKGYDYGVGAGLSELWVYRITHVDKEGNKEEFNFSEIRDFALTHGLKTVPIYYHGAAEDLFDIPIDGNFGKVFLSKLKEKYLDKYCEFCKNKVIGEGIVLKNNSRFGRPALKYKSESFSIEESKNRDKGVVDMEEES